MQPTFYISNERSIRRLKRTRLADRALPDYTRGEEIFNMVSHIVGGALGVSYLVLCVIVAAIHRNPWGIVGSAVYGASVISLFTMSSVYHGVSPSYTKKVMQVIDHCTIYFMIGGTYTPIALCTIREINPALGWSIFGIIWGIAALAVTLTAIDLNRFRIFSMICYIGMGWCIVLTAGPVFRSLGVSGTVFLIGGGVLYTVGAILYSLGKKKRYIHSLFHIFVVLASIMHFFCILLYVI